jgi:hypothetical protein
MNNMRILVTGYTGTTAKFTLVAVSAALILVLCVTGLSDIAVGANNPMPRCWIDYPLDGSTLDAGTSYQIIAHSTSPKGVAQTEFVVNEKVLGTVSNQSGSMATGAQAWQPGAAGQFTVKARCQDSSSNWGDYATAKVTVTGTGPRLILPGLQPPKIVLPQQAQTGTSFSDLNLSTNHFYYRATGCGPKQVTVELTAADPAGVDRVDIFYRLVDQISQKQTNWSSLPMQGAAGRNAGETRWSRVVNSESDIPDFANYANCWFQFYVKAHNKAGVEKQSETALKMVTLSACAGNLVR